ncbi:MAG: hypothetical protein EXS32_05295 [Opitutus sp.]|nr:hypothetical protein [Opitutus sp.]
MKTFPHSSTSRPQRGSALITVMLFSFVLLTLAGSVMQWSITERRMNTRSGYWLEARNAAEAVAEYGCYQVAQAFNSKMNPTFGSSGTNPISFPAALTSSFFAPKATGGATGSHVASTSISLTAGTVTRVPNTSLYYVDPLDPNNRFDPLVGRYVYRRDVKVLSKVTITPEAGSGSPVSSYIVETVSVRGAPLFAYAIFYSGNDLEFGESPKMDIYGPVHVNGNLFVGPVGSNALDFHGPVSASGHVFHAWRGTTAIAQEGSNTINNTTPVRFSTDSTVTGNPFNMRTAAGVWNDSTMGADSSTAGLAALLALVTPARTAAFAQYSSQTWKGNLQTSAMGIQSYNPMGFSEIVGVDASNNPILATNPLADDAANVGTGAGYGHGYGPHAMIEPAMALAASGDTYKVAKDAIEEQKFANRAGLYLKVVVTPGVAGAPDTLTPTLYGDPRSAPVGTPAINIGPNGGIKLGTPPPNVIQVIPYKTAVASGNTVVQTGMYDQHQDKGYNLVQLNMAALKTALTDMATASTTAGTDILAADNITKWGSGTANTGYDKYVASSTGWNGGIYVEVSSTSTKHTGLLLANGKVTSGGSLTPTGASAPNGITGLTIATNSPAFILGSFNADGVISTATATNSALYPDDTASGVAVTSSVEAPVAIAADAVTVLSPNYFNTGSGGSPTNLAPTTNMTAGSAYNSFNTNSPAVSGSVEIAAAIISGSVTTSPDASGTQAYSGGVHNFPRFLEHWGTNTVAIRGAMVSMYNSRIATVGWSQSYYSAPVRQWGFDQIFANGKFPPICPQVISYRRVDFTYLQNAAAYASELSRL